VSGHAQLVGDVLSKSADSIIDLATGTGTLFVLPDSPVGELIMSLAQIEPYNNPRSVNLYIAYAGSSTSSDKRHEMRSALRAWVEQFAVGMPLFTGDVTRTTTGYDVDGVPASVSNVAALVSKIAGVDTVLSVSADSPGNNALRIDVPALTLVRLGEIVINGYNT
jgi:hypothetical protein